MIWPTAEVQTPLGTVGIWSTNADHIGISTDDINNYNQKSPITVHGVEYNLRLDLDGNGKVIHRYGSRAHCIGGSLSNPAWKKIETIIPPLVMVWVKEHPEFLAQSKQIHREQQRERLLGEINTTQVKLASLKNSLADLDAEGA